MVAEKTAAKEAESPQAAVPPATSVVVEETAEETPGEEMPPSLQESAEAPAGASAGEVDNKE
ncbi:MAG: hypothetical protein A2991_00850 [Candidatus Terrybacteria bacterium RIFCSPLOWO2_01_FULL_58_14]|uniref:Uncharacterized protein n=1 Tax=Candidatus Terrybacteria bacterium RIFCSPLOWO2_01_FULL_58_14 TaxID=1802369 RepID=A0A1G2PZP8_9BACT|nr:MAG: hypothetical protein A2991_00850 [Candidatus Terrybacteria bacterium RIFCSPLOWO2_01_FULL_58_14]